MSPAGPLGWAALGPICDPSSGIGGACLTLLTPGVSSTSRIVDP